MLTCEAWLFIPNRYFLAAIQPPEPTYVSITECDPLNPLTILPICGSMKTSAFGAYPVRNHFRLSFNRQPISAPPVNRNRIMLRVSLQVICGMFFGVAMIVVSSLARFNIFDFPGLYWSVMFFAGMVVATICRDYFVLVPTWIVLGECLCLQDWNGFVGYVFILHFAAIPAYIGAIAGVCALELIDSSKLRWTKSNNAVKEPPFWEQWH